MSVTVDANVLLYASDRSSRFQEPALALLQDLAMGSDLLYLFWPVVMSYLRISTHPAVFDEPLTPQEAAANVEELISLPHVRTPGEGDGFWSLFKRVAPGPARGNLVPDIHLVALMRQQGVADIWSHDRDLRKFDGIRPRDPFGT